MGTVDMDASLKTAVVRLAATVFVEGTSWAARRQAGLAVGQACNLCR
jgi:hypothetical protein